MQTGLIQHCDLYSPGIHLANACVEVKAGRIAAIHGEGETLPDLPTLFDAQGQRVLPGFIDIHTHGASGHDVCDDEPDSIAVIAKAKIREGVTTFLPTTLTIGECDLRRSVAKVADYMKEPSFAKVPGLHIEGPFINPKCVGAQNPKFVRPPSIEELSQLREIAPIAIVSMAPEMEGGMEFIAAMKACGVVTSLAHTAATYAQVRAAVDYGAGHLTHFCNQMTPLHHREVGVVGAGLLADDLMIEIICDRIHLCPEMIALVFRSKPIEQLMLITDSMAASWMADDTYELGGMRVSVANGEARLQSGVLAGSTLRFNDALRNVFEITTLGLEKLTHTTGRNQAESLGLHDIGEIKPGASADIVVLDDQFVPTAVFVNGQNRLPEAL